MDVSSVKSTPTPPKQAIKSTPPVKPAPTQKAESNAAELKAQTAKPAPVVNTQGQQTGRLLNVVA